MSELHNCPYCRRAYSYRELILMKGKRHECKGCKRIFKVNRAMGCALMLVVMTALVIADVAFMHSTRDMSIGSFFTMTLTDAAMIFTAIMICPVLRRFERTEKKQGYGSPHRRL